MSVDFRIAFLSEHRHRPEARQWGSVIKERLPKSEGFCWEGYSWSRNWSPEELGRRQTVEGGDWADVILGFGSRSAWDRMAAWPEMARWRKEGKAILWLHAAPVEDPIEKMQSSDVDVIGREVWIQIDPLISWLSGFAEQSLGRRKERAQQEELQAQQEELRRLTRNWESLYRWKRRRWNPFIPENMVPEKMVAKHSLRAQAARCPPDEPRPLPSRENNELLDNAIKKLEAERQQLEAEHQQKEAKWEAERQQLVAERQQLEAERQQLEPERQQKGAKWEAKRQQLVAKWETERQQEEAQRWHNIELRCRGETSITVGAAPQTRNAADIYLVRVTGSKLSHAAREVHEGEHIPDPGTPVTDSVSCAVYSPPQWEGGTTELVQICIYLKKDLNSVETEALAVDPMARRLRAEVLGVDLSRNTRLSITLSLDPPCDISPLLAAGIWRGEAISVSFAVRILPVERRVRALGTVEIRLDRSAVPIGVMHFRVELVPQGTRTESVARPLGESARLTEFVFVSYASEDRSEVLRRVQGLKALGIQFFQDILSLSPGQRWAQELWRCIDQSDVFLLCWSSAASKSEWVRKEYLQANTTSGRSPDKRPHIAILALEGPPPPEPPPELKHLHFSDDLLYAIKVESDISAQARKHSND